MELDLRDYLRILRKRLWLILIVVILSSTVTGIVSVFFMSPIYEASTKLIVNKSNEPMSTTQLDLNTVNLNIRLIDTYKEIIKTVAIMDRVVEQYPQFKLTAEQLIKKVKVSSVNNTQVMTVAVQDESYDRAAQIVNAISKVFQSQIKEFMDIDNVSILSEAKPMDNPAPVKPNPKLNVVISFVVSLMVAVGIVFLLEYLDDTIKTEADVQRYLELPTLAMITKMKDQDLQVQAKKSVPAQVGESKHAIN